LREDRKSQAGKTGCPGLILRKVLVINMREGVQAGRVTSPLAGFKMSKTAWAARDQTT